MTGPYVSGMASSGIHVTPAMIRPSQKVQRQLTTAMKPEATGPIRGPKVVAAMKRAMARPREVGSL